MEHLDFKRLIDSLLGKNKETEWLEFKENFHSPDEIGQRISALSNSAYLCNMPYAYMVFGVNDNSLKVVGTDFFATRKKVGNEELESWLSTRLNPRIEFVLKITKVIRRSQGEKQDQFYNFFSPNFCFVK